MTDADDAAEYLRRLARLENKVDDLDRKLRILIGSLTGRCHECEEHVAGWHLRVGYLGTPALPKRPEINPANGHLWTCESQPR